ncbi:trypsin inhibitor ClTI-1-like [Paroedura picta]|uniref:trypsin inhibitor ClTI-1-like n=1 Tax=Paroedura picta TaxID=143630 RepID=UPI0040578317
MKATGVLLVFSLALGCFSGVKSSDENDGSQVSCDKYRVLQEFMACPSIFSPVCGTNGKTYDNECRICQDNAKDGHNIGMKYKGRCAEEQHGASYSQAFGTM